MRYILIITLLTATLLSGCNKCEPKNETNGVIIKDAIVKVISPSIPETRFISSANEYPVPIEVSFDGGITYEPVDFSEYSVFAMSTTASCSSGYNRNVAVNDAGQTVTYTITITECDYCEGTTTIANWVITSKVPASYTPIFEIN